MYKKQKRAGFLHCGITAITMAMLLFSMGKYPVVKAKGVDIQALRENIEKNWSGLPGDLEEKPLVAKSLNQGTISVYTDEDLMELCGQADGKTLKVHATDATKDALYCEYESEEGSGFGWIAMDTFISDPTFKKQYATVREDMPAFHQSNYKNGKTILPQYTGIIIVSAPGKKHQVLYDNGDSYALGWMKSKNLKNTLEYDGRSKKILMDGTYTLHSKQYNDGKKTYAEDPYPQELTFIYAKEDKYYIIDSARSWLSADTLDASEEQDVMVNASSTPMPDGLFQVTWHADGYEIRNDLTGYYLGIDSKGKLKLYAQPAGLQTVWRVSAKRKMVNKKKPMVITQYDPAWCGKPYGTDDITGSIGHAGCGLLAPINAAYALTGQYMNLMEIRDFAVDKHYRVIGSGTADSVFKGIAKTYGERYGFAWDGSSDKIKDLVKKLQQGDVAVSHVVGHYVAIVDCTPDGKKFLLLDSNRLPKRETSAFGDWVSVKRLETGTLSSTGYFFFKQFDGKTVIEKKKVKKKVKKNTTDTKKTTKKD